MVSREDEPLKMWANLGINLVTFLVVILWRKPFLSPQGTLVFKDHTVDHVMIVNCRPNWSSTFTTMSLLLLLLLLTVVVVFHIVVESHDCMVIQFTLLKHWPHMVVRSHNHIVISLDLFKDWPQDNIIPYSEILNSFVLWKAETIKCIWSLFCWLCVRTGCHYTDCVWWTLWSWYVTTPHGRQVWQLHGHHLISIQWLTSWKYHIFN